MEPAPCFHRIPWRGSEKNARNLPLLPPSIGVFPKAFPPRKGGEGHSIKSFFPSGTGSATFVLCLDLLLLESGISSALPRVRCCPGSWRCSLVGGHAPALAQGHKSFPARLCQHLRVETELILVDVPRSQGLDPDLCLEGRAGAEHGSVGSTGLFQRVNNRNCVIQGKE